MKKIDLKDKVFTRLKAIKIVSKTRFGEMVWECKCDCGNIMNVQGVNLRTGHTQSCGCLQKERASESNGTHRKSGTSTFNVWVKMRQRCNNPKDKAYKYYGGRGIKVCDRWLNSFDNFFSDMGEHKEGMSIDRIDNNGNYEPRNCQWLTISQNISKRNREYANTRR